MVLGTKPSIFHYTSCQYARAFSHIPLGEISWWRTNPYCSTLALAQHSTEQHREPRNGGKYPTIKITVALIFNGQLIARAALIQLHTPLQWWLQKDQGGYVWQNYTIEGRLNSFKNSQICGFQSTPTSSALHPYPSQLHAWCPSTHGHYTYMYTTVPARSSDTHKAGWQLKERFWSRAIVCVICLYL